ncbi:MAG: recombinase family protein [Myxococcota bacterium]
MRLVKMPGEQRVIARIARLRDRGESIRGIADALNAKGVEARGRQWYPTTAARILRGVDIDAA